MYERHIVIDLEFTPIPKNCVSQREIVKNEIIQIGAVMLDFNYRKISTFSTYVKPEFAYSVKPSVTKLTGITDLDLENAVRVGRKSPRSGRKEMTNPVKKKSPTALVGDLWD